MMSAQIETREPIGTKEMEFQTIEPKILYFGTPVALISTLNESDCHALPLWPVECHDVWRFEWLCEKNFQTYIRATRP
jgi:hypothetical protein